jgi:nucleoside-diphosphate-sugar epimerase
VNSKQSAKVVVTGASGHIGYHVAKALCEAGFAPDVLVRRLNVNVIDLARRGARVHEVDLRDRAKLVTRLDAADCVFHLAAENTTDLQAPERVIASTAGLTTDLLRAGVQGRVRTVVYTSSVVVLGRSPSPQRLLSEKDRTEV